MKRIIRLTESDLARIVRRVIKEQAEVGVESARMDPQTYVTIDGVNGATLSAVDIKNQSIKWTVTPSQSVTIDNKGTRIPNKGKFNLLIQLNGLKEAFTKLSIDCAAKQATVIDTQYPNNREGITLMLNMREAKNGQYASVAFRSVFPKNGTFKLAGLTQEMANKYCSAV
jgi:hypothetical protein